MSDVQGAGSANPAGGDRFAQGARPAAHGAIPAPIFPGTEEVDQYALFSAPGYTSPAPRVNSLAQNALWLATAGLLLFFIAPFTGVLAIWALVRASQLKGVGRRQALAALLISCISMGCWLALYLSFSV